MEVLGIEITIFQIILIVLLLVIGPLGYYNQKRIKKKQELEEQAMYGEYNKQDSSDNENDTESQQIISYVQSYKDAYPKEAIKSALINNGNTQDKVNSLVEKYY